MIYLQLGNERPVNKGRNLFHVTWNLALGPITSVASFSGSMVLKYVASEYHLKVDLAGSIIYAGDYYNSWRTLTQDQFRDLGHFADGVPISVHDITIISSLINM